MDSSVSSSEDCCRLCNTARASDESTIAEDLVDAEDEASASMDEKVYYADFGNDLEDLDDSFELRVWEKEAVKNTIREESEFKIRRCVNGLTRSVYQSLEHPLIEELGSLEPEEALIKFCDQGPPRLVIKVFCQLVNSMDVFQIPQGQPEPVPQQRNCIHCRSFKILEASHAKNFGLAANHGCTTCRLLRKVLDKYPSPLFPDEILVVLKSGTGRIQLFAKPIIDIWIASGKSPHFMHSAWAILSCRGENPDEELFMSKPKFIPEETSSWKSFEKILSWLKVCSNHPSCAPEDPKYLPTRVIDVGDRTMDLDQIRLRETWGFEGDELNSSYITLSHRWGTMDLACKTTRINYEANKQIIAWTTLSQTFKDAVHVTRRLGIRYLWIDSLCIIQDDKTDWEKESAKMASVYRNSFLTIAATKSHSGEDGLYSKLAGSASAISITESLSDTTLVIINAQKITHYSECGSKDRTLAEDFPLFTRGWAYQERFLSPRTLHFCTHELVWECREFMQCMCGEARRDVESSCTVERQENTQEDLMIQWRRSVEEYTRLRLTQPTDILPAFAGVAKKMKEKLDERSESGHKSCYLAGLWNVTLVWDLCWSNHGDHLNTRPIPALAPTWSWASISPSGVDYNGGLHSCTPQATIHGADCDLVSEDRMGQVKSGTIQISGSCIRFIFKHKYSDNLNDQETYAFFDRQSAIGDKLGGYGAWIYFDYDMVKDPNDGYYIKDETVVYCMKLLSIDIPDWIPARLHHCLLFRQHSDESKYSWERIGHVFMRGEGVNVKDPFDRSEEMTMNVH